MKMSLIDHFNAFHVRSQELGLTPNARSLYFAILGEFNKMQYPAQIKLQNTYLQHLSGINSTHSFNSARNALINAELISHKKQIYSLETVRKDFGNSSETFRKGFGNSLESSFSTTTISKNNVEKEKEKERDARAYTRDENANTATFNNLNSAEVQEMWFRCEGERIPGGIAFGLYELEQLHGTEALCKAIMAASQANTQPRLSFNFVKAVLDRQQKGESKNARTDARAVAEAWEQQQPDWLD